MLRKGGSVASNSVISAVQDGAFDGMNSRFTNMVAGCGSGKCSKCGGSLTLASVMRRDDAGSSYRLHNQKGGKSPFALVKPESNYAGGGKAKAKAKAKATKASKASKASKPTKSKQQKGGASGNLVDYTIPSTSTIGYVSGPGTNVQGRMMATEQVPAGVPITKTVAYGGVVGAADVQPFSYSSSSLTYAPVSGGAKTKPMPKKKATQPKKKTAPKKKATQPKKK